jgi:hypothetical protein
MKRLWLKSMFLLGILWGQSSTEVYLFDLVSKEDVYAISNPINISNNPGYDNQPSFMKHGRAVLYASTRNGQTDIVSYQIRTGKKTWLTNTEGSEYSPLQIGSGNAFSAIRLDQDGTQLLYKYSMYSKQGKVLIPDLKIGYHGWVDRNRLLSFVLGDPHTLQLSALKEGKNQILDEKIGRSIHKIPKTSLMSYISKQNVPWTINTLDPETGMTDLIIHAFDGSEDFAWTPSGIMFMGGGDILYKYDPNYDQDWVAMADLNDFGLNDITRLTVSPKGDKVVIVVVEKPVDK